MQLTVLVDNNTYIDRYFLAEPAVSYLIREGNLTVLFDVGYSDILIKNARKLNLPLWDVNFIVISHGHIDHTGGLEPLIKHYMEAAIEKIPHRQAVLVAHPKAFARKQTEDFADIGSLVPEEKLGLHFQLNLSRKPLWLSDNLVFLGEIERSNDFEAQQPMGKRVINNVTEDDYLWDDSALVYKSPAGLVIVTGCSHAGICNIISHARKVCREERVVDVIGGFHLLQPGETQLRKTLEFLKEVNPTSLHACHCTDLMSKVALAGVVPLAEVGVGLQLEY
jgi:7,8-dihydropterin-6-yl-methyl-4-(beta-D-ribofuranosyl)aminobenzene 5'-phosphate synthase